MTGAYSSTTPKGYPVDAQLYDEFTRQNIDRQESGNPGWKDYESWYEEVKLPKPQPQPQPQPESFYPGNQSIGLRRLD